MIKFVFQKMSSTSLYNNSAIFLFACNEIDPFKSEIKAQREAEQSLHESYNQFSQSASANMRFSSMQQIRLFNNMRKARYVFGVKGLS